MIFRLDKFSQTKYNINMEQIVLLQALVLWGIQSNFLFSEGKNNFYAG